MRELTDTTLHLTIQPKYSALMNVKHQQRIQDAFIQHKNQHVKVTITIETNKENNTETPADIAERVHDAQKQSAKKQFLLILQFNGL